MRPYELSQAEPPQTRPILFQISKKVLRNTDVTTKARGPGRGGQHVGGTQRIKNAYNLETKKRRRKIMISPLTSKTASWCPRNMNVRRNTRADIAPRAHSHRRGCSHRACSHRACSRHDWEHRTAAPHTPAESGWGVNRLLGWGVNALGPGPLMEKLRNGLRRGREASERGRSRCSTVVPLCLPLKS